MVSKPVSYQVAQRPGLVVFHRETYFESEQQEVGGGGKFLGY